MFTVERVYGAIHGGEDLLEGYREIYPGTELLRDLANLPQGTKVGVEEFDPLKDPLELPDNFTVQGGLYWQVITKVCEESGLNIVYLDDAKTYLRYAERILEAHKLRTEFNQYLEEIRSGQLVLDEGIEGRKRAFREAIFKAQVEAEYIHIEDREQAMMKKIVNEQPQIAIVGAGHGDYWMAATEYDQKREFEIGEYRREFVPGRLVPFSRGVISREQPYRGQIDIIMPRRLLQRKLNAVTHGRIFTDKEPDFIGTWNLDSPTQGLFEMYVSGKNSVGMTYGEKYDILGDAEFSGWVDTDLESGLLGIQKDYILGRSAGTFKHRPIKYIGRFDHGICRGNYSTESGFSGEFIMNSGNKLLI